MITLYKRGNAAVIRGVECQPKQFKVSELNHAKANGWFTSPSDAYDDVPKAEVDTNNSGKLSNKEVRAAAKKAGIESWDKRRISSLKEELGLDG